MIRFVHTSHMRIIQQQHPLWCVCVYVCVSVCGNHTSYIERLYRSSCAFHILVQYSPPSADGFFSSLVSASVQNMRISYSNATRHFRVYFTTLCMLSIVYAFIRADMFRIYRI